MTAYWTEYDHNNSILFILNKL